MKSGSRGGLTPLLLWLLAVLIHPWACMCRAGERCAGKGGGRRRTEWERKRMGGWEDGDPCGGPDEERAPAGGYKTQPSPTVKNVSRVQTNRLVVKFFCSKCV